MSAEMDGEVGLRTLLQSWSVSDAVIRKFIDEEISLTSLKHLQESTVLALIPKKGPRDNFIHHWSAWKDESESIDLDDPAPKKRRTEPDAYKAFLEDVLAKPVINGLHEFLLKSIPGLTVLAFYEKNGELDNYSRDLLGEQVIYNELQGDYAKSISRSQFDKIADSIVELFPAESKVTWFDVVRKGKSSVVEGRLRFKFYSVRRGLYRASLIPKPTVQRDLDVASPELEEFDNAELDEACNLRLNSPWQQIRDSWETTHKARAQYLKQVDSISDYFEKFPVLKHPLGWKLIAEDGEKFQPCLKYMEGLWEDYSKFLLTVLQKENPKLSSKSGEEPNNRDLQFLGFISKIPSLFKVRTLPKSSKAAKTDRKLYRPSAKEVQDAFCLHLTDIALLDEKLDQRREKLTRYKYSLQPVPVVIGTKSEIRQCFIVLDSCRWEVDSPSTAVWGVMKLSFGLNASYPIEARHVYLFLQLTMLKLSLDQDFAGDKGLKSFLAARLKQHELFLKNAE